MYLIVGLGNPENEYSKTRHNMGFDTINEIANKYDIDLKTTKFNAQCGSGIIAGKKVILIKPQTYMNLSGKSVREFVNFYKIEKEELIVVYDDMDIQKGQIKIRKKGGAGGHNGMKSLIQELSSEEFIRVRVGIGKPVYEEDRINYVIGKVDDDEYDVLMNGVKKAKEAVIEILKNGIDTAMNIYN